MQWGETQIFKLFDDISFFLVKSSIYGILHGEIVLVSTWYFYLSVPFPELQKCDQKERPDTLNATQKSQLFAKYHF